MKIKIVNKHQGKSHRAYNIFQSKCATQYTWWEQWNLDLWKAQWLT